MLKTASPLILLLLLVIVPSSYTLKINIGECCKCSTPSPSPTPPISRRTFFTQDGGYLTSPVRYVDVYFCAGGGAGGQGGFAENVCNDTFPHDAYAGGGGGGGGGCMEILGIPSMNRTWIDFIIGKGGKGRNGTGEAGQQTQVSINGRMYIVYGGGGGNSGHIQGGFISSEGGGGGGISGPGETPTTPNQQGGKGGDSPPTLPRGGDGGAIAREYTDECDSHVTRYQQVQNAGTVTQDVIHSNGAGGGAGQVGIQERGYTPAQGGGNFVSNNVFNNGGSGDYQGGGGGASGFKGFIGYPAGVGGEGGIQDTNGIKGGYGGGGGGGGARGGIGGDGGGGILMILERDS